MKNMRVAFILFALLSVACRREEPIRRYVEKQSPRSNATTFREQTPGTSSSAKANATLEWDLPQGWMSFPPSGMRIATLKPPLSDTGTPECYILSLAGDGGGVQANIERWMKQVGVAPDKIDVEAFINGQKRLTSRGGLTTLIIDMGELVSADTSQSMLAAIVSETASTYFLKMAGPKNELTRYKQAFTEICASLR
ncbi:MAG: hypothetical protein GF398_06495 [Chitinivibrionales bacterium]|nr:hypothetical protein [Chitinivibrionales bacterium]